MTSVSQENLRKLAMEAEAGGDYQAACGHLEEALRLGFDEDLALDLSRLLRLNKEEDQAYALIKALPDLFSRDKVLEEYGQVLAANNFLI